MRHCLDNPRLFVELQNCLYKVGKHVIQKEIMIEIKE